MLPGVLMYDQGIELNEEIVIVTTKGEAVAIGKYIFKVTVMFNSQHCLTFYIILFQNCST